MSDNLDLGNHPIGTPPTLSEASHLRGLFGMVVNPNAVGSVASLLDFTLFNIYGPVAYVIDPLSVSAVNISNGGGAGALNFRGFSNLSTLYFTSNHLSTLDVTGCTSLAALWGQGNALTSLDVAGCTSLSTLYCTDNQLTALDVSSCTSLSALYCNDNQLTALDAGSCTSLSILYCDSNQLTTLDVSTCTSLYCLSCYTNLLTSLDVTGCTGLYYLDCGDNQLTTLDVTGYTSLSILYCSRNQLTTLDVTGCTALTTLWGYGNQFTQVAVDSILNTLCELELSNGQCNLSGGTSSYASAASATARAALLSRGWTLSLNRAPCAIGDIAAYMDPSLFTVTTGSAIPNDPQSVTNISVAYNNASGELHLGDLINLNFLSCGGNQLTTLDVTGCATITLLGCEGNQITSLDVSTCTGLGALYCSNNLLTTLGVTACTSLATLNCYNNQLTTLVANAYLSTLDCNHNNLTTLDVSTCTSLSYLNCSTNQLTTLDISFCTAIGSNGTLNCYNNQLTQSSVDTILNTLMGLHAGCGNYDLSGGLNAAPSPNSAEAIAYLTRWYSTVTTNATGPFLFSVLGGIAAYMDTSQFVVIGGNSAIAIDPLAVTGVSIGGHLETGELHFNSLTNLVTLDCQNNALTVLEVVDCSYLVSLDCHNNQITSLDVGFHTNLYALDCSGNPLTSFGIYGCTGLHELYCQNTVLTGLNLGGCTALTNVVCYGNQFTTLDVSGCTSLTYLDCSYNLLSAAAQSAILVVLAANGQTGGTCDLSGDGNEVWTGVDGGADALTWLQANGWSVTFNVLAFTPMALSPVLWLDASDSSTLLNEDMATPASDNAPANYWMDKSGHNNYLHKNVYTSALTRIPAAQNGKDVARFPGNVYMGATAPSALPTGNSPWTVFTVVKPARGTGVDECVWGWGNDAGACNRKDLWLQGGIVRSELANRSMLGGTTPTAFSVLTQRYPGTTWYDIEHYQDGTLQTTTPSGGADRTMNLWSSYFLAVGDVPQGWAGYPFMGDIGEIILLPYAATTEERQNVEAYLKAKWGTP